MSSDEQSLRHHHTTWMAAVNAGDLATLLGLITDDVVLCNPGGPPIGREGFAAKFTEAHKQLRIDCVSEIHELVVAGDLAYSLCHDTLAVTPHAGGVTTRLAGDRLTIYHKQPDGRWLLARDAHTLVPVE
ncbi:MAG: SgcJ/EcaC family oxidoreductase [Tepidisphaeraceae bacterium]